jgi:sulfur-oxidizing protein SoxY
MAQAQSWDLRLKMKDKQTPLLLDRRAFAAGAAAMVLVAGTAGQLSAQATEPVWQQTLRSLVGDAKPIEGKVTLELPEIAENGNTVPLTVSVESPMTGTDYVKAIHVLATENPQPGVATFRFSPLSGKASAASRMRLARTQEVIALAELSDGKFLIGRRTVKVTIGGCGG